jgi:acetyl esterase
MDPRARRFLDMLAAAKAKGEASESVAERRSAYRSLMRLSDIRGPICDIEDRAAPSRDGPVPVRIYSPAGSSGKRLPGLVYFHGGGLVAGGLDDYRGLCSVLAQAIGCRLAAVGYRLAPEHKFPAAVDDAFAATRWVVEIASEIGIDGERIGIGGDSGGGTLAAVTCRAAREGKGLGLALQLLLCPVLDSDPQTPSRQMFAEGHLLERETLRRDLAYYASANFDPLDPRVSPLRAGVEVHHECHAGMIHHFYGMASLIPHAKEALARIGAQVRAALG